MDAAASAAMNPDTPAQQPRRHLAFLRLLPFWTILAAYLTLPLGVIKDWGDTNALSRLYLASALAERGSFDITPETYRLKHLDDSVQIDGRFYSNKAPGSSYWLWAVSKPLQMALSLRRPFKISELAFWGRIFALIVPFMVFLYMLGRHLERRTGDPVSAWLAVGAFALGTNAALYTMAYYGHVLAAILIGIAWIRSSDARGETRLLEGFLLGCAVAVEYNSVPVVVVAAARSILVPGRGSRIFACATLAAGALMPAAALAAYHAGVTGNPLIPPFHYDKVWRGHFPRDAGLPFGMQWPSLTGFAQQWFSPSRGIVFHSPWIAVSILCAVWTAIRNSSDGRPGTRREIRWCLAAIGLYAVAMSGYLGWKVGFSTGMRLFILILPLAALLSGYGLAASSKPVRLTWLSLATLSVAVFAVLGTTFPIYDTPHERFDYNMISTVTFPAWTQGRILHLWPHVFGMGFGTSLALMLGLPAAAWAAMVWTLYAPPGRSSLRRWTVFGTSAAAVAVVSAALLAGWLRVGAGIEDRPRHEVDYWLNFLYSPEQDLKHDPFSQGIWSKFYRPGEGIPVLVKKKSASSGSEPADVGWGGDLQ